MNISKKDIEILRNVASEYMEYASLPIQNEKRKLWENLNSLNMQKPMLAIDQLPWNELNVDGSLTCFVENPYFRNVESELRKQIYKWKHFPADMVLNPYILIPRIIENTGYGIKAKAESISKDPNSTAYSSHYNNLISDYGDLEKIKTPQISINREFEAELYQTASEIFKGIAPVKLRGFILHMGLWDFISQWMGVENCYIELMDRPEFMHAIMEKLTVATLDMLKQINDLGLYDINENICHCSYTFDSTLPAKDCDLNNPTSRDGWGFGLAQLFTAVSPDITNEFEVPYIKRIAEKFGAIYYGCCDRLDDRLDIVTKIPNIRKISCSPWSDRENFALKLPKKYIMSNKPTPALLAGSSFDEDAIRADLRRTMQAAKDGGVCLEMILKDLSTVNHRPERLTRWSEIASEETLNFAFK